MESFRNRRISVIGAARSGLSAVRILTQLGAQVLLSDSKTADQLGAARMADIAAAGAKQAEQAGTPVLLEYVLGADADAALPTGTDLVITSPGVPATASVLVTAKARGIPIWSEIELAYRLTQAPLVATTGTNGKTTTTLLIASMLEAAGKNVLICGNVSADEIKRTLVDAAVEAEREKGRRGGGEQLPILVAEVSSFQLEWVVEFAPRVGILTNVTPDHLNRHASFEEYAQSKARLFTAQDPDDWAVLNYDNDAARRIGQSGLPGRRCWFTRAEALPDDGPGGWVQYGTLMARLAPGEAPVSVIAAAELPPSLPGAHSVENVLAASLAALILGATPEVVRAAARSFSGVAHRMEFVADIAGVRYINNSMCTNVAAAASSLRAMDRPTIVIAGGADKELEYAPLVPALRECARHVILIGQAADKMEASFRVGGYTAITRADSLQEAISIAARMARPGDAVLLSPACASFDMFADFEARGAAFRQAVNKLKEIME